MRLCLAIAVLVAFVTTARAAGDDEERARGHYEVTNESPLARAAKMNEAAGFNRWVENLQKVSVETQDPSWLDRVDNDTAAVDLADIYSVRPEWVASDEAVAAKRKMRAQAEQQKQELAALPGRAQMVTAQAKMASAGQPAPPGQAVGAPGVG